MSIKKSDYSDWYQKYNSYHFDEYRQKEKEATLAATKNQHVIDFCCGDADILKTIHPYINSYVGIDLDEKVILKARANAKNLANVVIKDPMNYKSFLHEQVDLIQKNTPSIGICIGNSLGILSEPVEQHVTEMFKYVDQLFISAVKKGCMEIRINTYKAWGDNFEVDYQKETIKIPGYTVRAFSRHELEDYKKLLLRLGCKSLNYYDFNEASHGILFSKGS